VQEASVRTEIRTPGSVPDSKLTYVVMAATYNGDWIFVRHRDRTTWELPAGHIEPGETAFQAAVRELFEEAGVVRSSLTHLCDYAVTAGERTEYGRLFKAAVEEVTEVLEFETDEILLTGVLPAELTYPDVQTVLFEFALR
jgi:8-oxo-dGTP diphosphatase